MQSRFFSGSSIIVLETQIVHVLKIKHHDLIFVNIFALVLSFLFFLVQLYRWFYIWFVWMPPVIFISVFDFLSSAFGPDQARLLFCPSSSRVCLFLFSFSFLSLFLSHSISLLRFSINATWRLFTIALEQIQLGISKKNYLKKELFITLRTVYISATSSLISNDFGKRKLHDYQSNIKKKSPLQVAIIPLTLFSPAFRRALWIFLSRTYYAIITIDGNFAYIIWFFIVHACCLSSHLKPFFRYKKLHGRIY